LEHWIIHWGLVLVGTKAMMMVHVDFGWRLGGQE